MKNSLASYSALALLAAITTPALAQSLLWTRQFGTSAWDRGYAIAVDGAGHSYLSGYTEGSLGGPSAGSWDAFLAKYDASGALLWTRRLGTEGIDSGQGVAVDGAGNAYVAGYTYGSLGGSNAGGQDAFLAKYDAEGIMLWTRQIGTPEGDFGYGIAVDGAGSVYICGETRGSLGGPFAGSSDAFLAKYDAEGIMLWTRQLGRSAQDSGNAVAVDGAGNAYIGGTAHGILGGTTAEKDAFLAKYDSTGNRLWTRQLGSTGTSDIGCAVAMDGAGNAYISGFTGGSLGGSNAGGQDAFLAKYDAEGTLLWTRQLGTRGSDYCYGVAVDGVGNAYISGWTYGNRDGATFDSTYAFVAKYDSAGDLLWTRQLGTDSPTFGYAVGVDGAGNAYLGGYAEGDLGGTSAGGYDVFLAKFSGSCLADLDNDGDFGNGLARDGAVTIEDLLSFLVGFEAGNVLVDLDNGTNTGTPDNAVDINDLLFFLARFEAGC